MPSLPDLDLRTGINRSPHVVILGAGASRAALPGGDANGKQLPVMADLIDCLELRSAIEAAGFSKDADFESIYDELATSGRDPSLKSEIESRLQSYFEALDVPDTPTLYDYLLLSLRENDYIATFNWDPFLAKAYMRNRLIANLPTLLFLHGNVQIGICPSDRIMGFRGDTCPKCGASLQPSRLLYPVKQKDYNIDPLIADQWRKLDAALKNGYMLTIFGYSAPVTDVEAVDLLLRGWGTNPTFELAQVQIVDIRAEEDLKNTWKRFLCRAHYGISADIWRTRLFRYPRRSCESLAMATLQNDPWRDNPFPKLKSLSQLHAWIAPLVAEGKNGRFTGNPCLQPQDFSETASQPIKRVGLDQVLGWLKAMCRGGLIPPFCVEIVLRDGARYNLHSIVSFDDETRTMCARIWDFRAFRPGEIMELKQKLNQLSERSKLAPAEAVHPKLDWANLRVHYDDISYCVEWHDRVWPDDEVSRIGIVNDD